MLNKELEHNLNQIFRQAKEKRHQYITTEHLLLALLNNSSALEVLHASRVNTENLRKNITQYLDETIQILPKNNMDTETEATKAFQRVLQRAVFHVQSSGKTEVNGANILAALFSEYDSKAVTFLREENITRLDVVNYNMRHVSKILDERFNEPMQSPIEESYENEAKTNPLENYCLNLNERALMGRIDPLIGRKEEVQRTIQILCRRRKNNPLLVGEAGVGKTAIAEGLAKHIVEGKTPEAISKSVIYSLDLGSLLAGTKYRGDFEKRLKNILYQLKNIPDAVLFIDEIHTIIGAGAASGGVLDASNLIKPLLANGELKCIGSTTYQEYRSIFEKDRALARRFQKIDVPEATVEESIDILKGLKSRLESHHHVRFSEDALHAAAHLANRFLTDRFLPDKAIDVVDEAGAYQNLLPIAQRKMVIDVNEVESIVARMARIPAKKVTISDKNKLKHLERNLKLLVFGQNKAIENISSAIKLSRSGLREPNKPVGSYLFAGPTGVGKTEVTRQLAKVLGIELVRFDMSEYMEKHTVSRLIGAPPGYVGYDQGGLLTEAINKNPHSVLLLDEIEKAHPDVFNLLLQVMDHGMLTDSNGRKTNFRHTIIVMTSNAGAMEMSRSSIGFTHQDHKSDGLEAVNRLFSPEFRNRLDAIVHFESLNSKVIRKIVDKFILELEAQLEEKNVFLTVDENAKHWLAQHGYDEVMGARPMARLIQEKIKTPLADELLFGQLAEKGGRVRLVVDQDELKLELSAERSLETD